MKNLGKTRYTGRGFQIIDFKDYYDTGCSIQESSLAVEGGALWIGCSDPNPKILASQASKFGVETKETTGWIPYPIPEGVSCTTRMHLNREQVEALVNHLQKWLDKGIL